jgi:hypothetical protein
MDDDQAPPGSRRDRRRLEHLARSSGEGPGSLPESHRSIWVASRTEFDKQLLGLSSAGIGLLVGLAKTLSPMSTPISVAFGVSLAAFVGCALLMLYLLRVNADFVEADASGSDERRSRLATALRTLDLTACLLFALGVLATAAVAILAAF